MKPVHNISCLQVWMPALHQTGVEALHKQLYSDPELFIMGCAALASFRLSSCQSMQWGHQGMPGRVLRSGCVQVVQNLRIIPDVLHPRCRLPEAVADEVGEVVYVPVYDLQCPHAGPQAVLEALLSSRATDSMLVANFISVAGNVLSALQLSLSNPLPQPVRRSKLEGRKPRPVHIDSSPELPSHCNPEAAVATVVVASAAPATQAVVPTGLPAAAAHFALIGKGQEQDAADSIAAATATDVLQRQHTSSSSASAGTWAVASLATAASVGTDCTLSSTLSSRPRDSPVGADVAAAGTMLPPRPHARGSAGGQQQHRRQRWQQDCDSTNDSDDGDASPPPCKLRRTLSMARTKSVPIGLDQVLQEAVAGSEPTTSC